MEDPYQHFLSSMSRAGMQQVSGFANVHPQAFHGMPIPTGGSPMGVPQPQAIEDRGSKDPVIIDASKSKSRKKAVTPGGDVVKHRRTRSGCFTCRSRRVKCDEKRPVCERCQKGNRECVYPDPPSRKGNSSRTSPSKDAGTPPGKETLISSSVGDKEDGGESGSRLETIPDEDEPEEDTEHSASVAPSNADTTPPGSHRLVGRQTSETPSQEDNRSSPSSSTAASSGFLTVPYDPSEFPQASEGLPDWSHLPSDYRFHLNWFVENMTHYHYGINHDPDDFFKIILPRTALQNEALLNALVGFSAYQTTILNPNGKIQNFLGYYNKSVTLLLEFLRRNERHNVSTLLTILQLAQIEEYLGDWVNILGHQKAALEIFTKIFSPQTVTHTPMARMCLNWYARFDIFVSFMGSFPPGLPKDYFDSMRSFFQSQMALYPGDLNWVIADRRVHLRQISWHQAVLYARRNRGQISPSDFSKEHQRLTKALEDYRNGWDPSLVDPKYLVTDFGGRQPDPEDIVNPYEPGILYDFPLFSSTISGAEWHSVMIMHMILATHLAPEELFADLEKHAMAVCRYYETIEYWPKRPKGVMILIQSVVQTASLFLPKDEKHHMWVRRKNAYAESIGYIRPLSHREKMAEFFRDPSCVRWWLPNDEGFTPILKSIREFADERNAVAVTAQQESVREVKQLYTKFVNMDLEGDTSTGDGKGRNRLDKNPDIWFAG